MMYILDKHIYNKWLSYKEDEHDEFVHLHKNLYAILDIDIALDDDMSYIYREHPLWLYFRNGYNNENDWIPLVISETECYIPLQDMQLNITAYDYAQLCMYGKTFYKFIKRLADKEIDISYYISSVYSLYNLLNESNQYTPLNEMAVLPSSISGLPRDLYIDDDQTYLKGKHGPRLKYKSPTYEKNKRRWPSVLFSDKINDDTDLDDIKVYIKDKKQQNDISSEELNHIKYFVKANVQLLLQVANKEISFDYFKTAFTKVDKNGNILYKPNVKDYITYKSAGYGYDMVKRNTDGRYNYIKNGKLLSTNWFFTAEPFIKMGNSIHAFVRDDKGYATIDINGNIKYF